MHRELTPQLVDLTRCLYWYVLLFKQALYEKRSVQKSFEKKKHEKDFICHLMMFSQTMKNDSVHGNKGPRAPTLKKTILYS